MFCNLAFNITSNTIHFCRAWYAKDVTPVLNVPSFLVAKTFNFISTALSNVSWCPGPKEGTLDKASARGPARGRPCCRHRPTQHGRPGPASMPAAAHRPPATPSPAPAFIRYWFFRPLKTEQHVGLSRPQV